MRIALAGPARLDELRSLLDEEPPASATPISGGSPVSALARALHGRGHDVVVATLAHGVTAPIRLVGDRFELQVGPYRPRHRARDVFAAERRVLEVGLRRADPDVVHAHWTYEFALAALAARAPAVVTVRDWAPTILRLQPHPYRVVRLLMAARVLRQAPRLTVTSPYLGSRVRRWARGEVDLIPNAIADEDFLEELPTWSPDPAAPRLVAIGNGWDARKNVATLLDAFVRLRRDRPGAELQLVGHGYGPDGPAARHARTNGGDAGVSFVGPLPYRRAMSLLTTADVFVHPSREESFGLVLVEAMARGVPVVAGADSGAVPWVCDDGRSGVLVDVDSVTTLATGVATVLDDVDATRRRRERAHRDARQRFALSAVTDRYEATYRSAREEAT